MLDLKKWMAKVSAWIAGADERYVNITGDTMTGRLTYKSSDVDTTQTNNGVTADTDSISPIYRDVNDRYTGFLDNIAYTSGNIGTSIYASNYDSSGNRKNNYLGVAVAKDGTQTYSIASPAAFRTTIGAVNKAGDTMTGDLVVSTSNSTSRVRVTTSATNIVLAAQNGGHHGLWSDTLQKWIVYGLTGGIVKVNETTIPASATLVQMSQQGWGTSLSFNCTKNHAIVLMSSQILLIWLASTNDVNTLLVQGGATPVVKSGTGNVTNGNWKVTRSGTNVTINAVSGSATMTAFYV